MRKPTLILFVTSLILLALLATVAVASIGVTSAGQIAPQAPPPLLAPPDSDGYERQSSSDAPITADDGRPVAQFRQPPAGFAESVEVSLPEMKAWGDAESEAYAVLASVRYSGPAGEILVTTARPSPGALHGGWVSTLGEQNEQGLKLAGRTKVWLFTDMGGDFPNRLLFMHGDLVITVAGSQPPATLQELAEQVEIK